MKFLRLTIFMARSMHIISMYPNIKYWENICNRLKEKPEVPKCQMLAANILKHRWIQTGNFGFKVEKLYYPCSENKGADQLRSYCEADLRLCFCLCRLLVFP